MIHSSACQQQADTHPALWDEPWPSKLHHSLGHDHPKFFKPGTKMLESGSFSSHHLTELAGATGTVELLDGSRKKAKRMFVQSVLAPTGSSLAQAEWATPSLGSEIIDERTMRAATEPFEAEAYHLYRAGRFSEVANACDRWAQVEAFSIRPFEFGSTAAGHAEDFDKAIEMASEGLRRRPSPLLINSLAYALNSNGDHLRAEQELAKIKLLQVEPRIQFLTVANFAMAAFRRGDTKDGLALYRTAIEGFTKHGFRQAAASAKVFLAREALQAEFPEGRALLKDAQDAIRPFPSIEAARVLRKVEIAAGEKPRELPSHITPPDVEASSAPKPLPSKEIRWTTPGWKGFEQR